MTLKDKETWVVISHMQNSVRVGGGGVRALFIFGALVEVVLGIRPSLGWTATFDIQPFSDSVQGAPAIVRGTIGVNHADWSKDAEAVVRLYTYYELQIKEVVKGPSKLGDSPTMMIRELGGEKEGVSMQITGTAQFSPGEDVVVFLKAVNPDSSYDILGMMTGKYGVKTDESGEEYLIGAATAPPPPRPGSQYPTWTFKQLKEEVLRQGQGVRPVQQILPGTAQEKASPVVPAESPRPTPTSVPDVSGGSLSWILYVGLGALVVAGIYLLRNGRNKRG